VPVSIGMARNWQSASRANRLWNGFCYNDGHSKVGQERWIYMAGILRSFAGAVLGVLVSMASAAFGLAQVSSVPLPGPVGAIAVQASGQVLAGHNLAITQLNTDWSEGSALGIVGASEIGIANDGGLVVGTSGSVRTVNAQWEQQTIFFRGNAFALQPDGKVVLLEQTSLARRAVDGTPDPSFSGTPFETMVFPVFGMIRPALQEDGKIVLAAMQDGSILRYHANGARDEGFTAPKLEPSFVHAIVPQRDGKILIGGEFEKAGEIPRKGLLRLNADGSLDASFNPASELGEIVLGMALQANGKIVVSGAARWTAGLGPTKLVRLDPDGTLDTSFPEGAFVRPMARRMPLVLHEDGAVLIGSSTNLVRLANPDLATRSLTREGSTLSWLNGGSAPEVFHARFQASVDGIAWTDLGAGQRIEGGWRLEGAAIPDGARLRVRGYVSGTSHHLDFVPGAPALYLQPADRTNVVNTDAVFRVVAKGQEPLSYQWLKDGQALAGAQTEMLALSNVNGGLAGGYSVVVSNAAGSSTSRVATLTVIDPVIFEQPKSVWINAGEEAELSVMAAGTGLTYQWKKNGEPIPGATSPTLTFSNASSTQSATYQVVLTGTYGTLESDVVSVHVNHALPDSWNPKYEPTSEWFPIQTVAARDEEFFIGGLFRTLEAPSRQHLVKFAADQTIDAAFGPEVTGEASAGVSVVTVSPNGQILVGGTFLTVAGQSQPYLARLEPDGRLDEHFKPQLAGLMGGNYTQASAIAIQPDGRILIGGDFLTVNGQARPGVARLFPDGTLDGSFTPKVQDVPRVTWGLLVQGDGKIIAYGWDYRRLNPDGSLDTEFLKALPGGIVGEPLLLPNDRLLVSARANGSEATITLLNADGTVDPSFGGGIACGGLQAVQADGKILVTKHAETIPIVIPNGTRWLDRVALIRLNMDGTEDPSFSPVFETFGTVKAMLGDGSFIFAGSFTNLAGVRLPGLARLRNTEPASETLTFDGSNAIWLRSGTSPEVTRTIFEHSLDGLTWTHLGAGVRIPGGWELDNVNLGPAGILRARGFFKGSIYEASLPLGGELKLQMANYDAAKGMTFNASGPRGGVVVLQTSTDLKQWTSLRTNSLGDLLLPLTLTNSPSPSAFFRLLQIQ
jgi:uncharacterized delta-60 repeat protein